MNIKKITGAKRTPPKTLRLSLCGSTPPRSATLRRKLHRLCRILSAAAPLIWLAVGVICLVLFPFCADAANARRMNPAPGGELVILGLGIYGALKGAAALLTTKSDRR